MIRKSVKEATVGPRRQLVFLTGIAALLAVLAASPATLSATDADAEVISTFVKQLPRHPGGVAFTPALPERATMRERLPVGVEIKSKGYLAAVYISSDGTVTFLASGHPVVPGSASLWKLLDTEEPTVTAPEGYDLLIVLLDPLAPWTGESGLESQVLGADTARKSELLGRIAGQIARSRAAVALHIFEIVEEAGSTRALKKKKSPGIPPWLAAIRG